MYGDTVVCRTFRHGNSCALSVIGFAGLIFAQQQPVLTLQLGHTLRGHLGPKITDSYVLPIRASEYARFSIRATGAEIEASLVDPNGVSTVEWVAPGGIQHISIVHQADGAYRIDLRSSTPEGGGEYSITTEEVRDANASDNVRVRAENTLRKGKELVRKQTPASTQQSITLFQQSLALSRSVQDVETEAEALTRVGEAYAALNENGKALEYLNQALEKWKLIRDVWREAETVDDLGGLYFSRGDRTQAIKFFATALELSRSAGFVLGEASALGDLAVVYSEIGENKKSVDLLQSALNFFQDLGDRRSQGRTLSSLAGSYHNLGMQTQAIDACSRSLPLARSAHDRYAEAAVLNNVAAAYSSTGEKQKALDSYTEALPIEREVGDRQGEANTLVNIGSIYDSLGDPGSALEDYQKALAIANTIRDLDLEMRVRVREATIDRDSGSLAKALELLSNAMRLAEQLQDRRWKSIILNDIGTIHFRSGDARRALEFYGRARLLRQELGNPSELSITLNDIGEAYGAIRDPASALRAYDEALALSRSVGDRRTEAMTLYHLARTKAQQGDFVQASSLNEQAVQVIEALRIKIAAQELRSSYVTTVREYFDLYIDTLMRLDQIHPQEGYAALALQVCERSRARSLLEQLTENGIDIRQGIDSALLDDQRSIRQQLEYYSERKLKLAGSKTKNEQFEEARRRVEDLELEYRNVEVNLRRASPQYAALTQPQPLTAAEMQHQITDENTSILEYSLGARRSFLWVIDPNAVRTFELPKREDIEGVARDFYLDLSTGSGKEIARSKFQPKTRRDAAERKRALLGNRLSAMILGPAVPLIGARRLVIIPDGALNYIPFAALPDPISPAEGVPLIVRHEIVYAPSGSVLALLRRTTTPRNTASKLLAVFADPVFDIGDPRLRNGSGGKPGSAKVRDHSLERSMKDIGANPGSSLARLPFSRVEAEGIYSLVGAADSMKALDFDASLATATSPDLSKYRLVHFATHGLLDSENPILSGLVLSLFDKQGQTQPGFLNLAGIYNLKLSADLVVLSACQTGMGKYVSGEGLIGLTRAFMYAGVPRVIASVWNVDDLATAELMKHFYASMVREHMRPAAALRNAQVYLWQQKSFRSPYYWAPFLLEGEWK
jgi:CHAT domain-containing protein/tetratricopeptide (TPR) repeat protein